MKNVLLLGNGIDRIFNSHGISWQELLNKMTTNPNIPEHHGLPFPLEVVLRTNDHVDEALKEHRKDLFSSAEDAGLREILGQFLTMGFDEILTTNYDYTIEGTALYPKPITAYRIEKMMRHTPEIRQAERSYMIHTYNEVSYGGINNRIWHIHGEARKPSSIVIGHYMYVNLVSQWRVKVKKREKSYRTFDHTKASACWLDSFIMGNVYILGFGFDFSELDLWWLINRKKRENAEPHGKVIFYTPEKSSEAGKYALLSAYGVEVRHLDFELMENIEEDPCEEDRSSYDEQKKKIEDFNKNAYTYFYKKAIEDIKADAGL